MKNLFAIIGLFIVLKKGINLYREYREMKRERKTQRSSST